MQESRLFKLGELPRAFQTSFRVEEKHATSSFTRGVFDGTANGTKDNERDDMLWRQTGKSSLMTRIVPNDSWGTGTQSVDDPPV